MFKVSTPSLHIPRKNAYPLKIFPPPIESRLPRGGEPEPRKMLPPPIESRARPSLQIQRIKNKKKTNHYQN